MKVGIALIFLLINFIKNQTCSKLIEAANFDDSALTNEIISKNMNSLKTEEKYLNLYSCIISLLNKGYFTAAETYITELSKRGIKYREQLKIGINYISKRLEEIYNKYRFDENDFQVVSPAFQYAQSMDKVFIEVKFAHRHDSPGCLEVKSHNVEIVNNVVLFEAFCVMGDTPIKFDLKLELFTDVDTEKSVHSLSSVGRYQMTLMKKQTGMYWDNLLKDGFPKPSNMRAWMEMREKFYEEIQQYVEEDEEMEYKKVEEEIEKKNKKKGKKKKSN